MNLRLIRRTTLLLLSLTLVMGIVLPARMAEASSARRMTQEHPPPAEPCLVLTMTFPLAIQANSANMAVSAKNTCPFDVQGVSVHVRAHPLCEGAGASDADGWMSYWDVHDEGIVRVGWPATIMPMEFLAYCIVCTDGVMTFPPFEVEFSADVLTGLSNDQSQVLVTNAPGNLVTATVPMTNEDKNPGLYECP